MVGGLANVRISRDDYNHALAASKPSSMTLPFVDKLFSKETLLRSTLYGTKEFAALNPSWIFAKQAITANVINCHLLDIVLVCHAITFINQFIQLVKVLVSTMCIEVFSHLYCVL